MKSKKAHLPKQILTDDEYKAGITALLMTPPDTLLPLDQAAAVLMLASQGDRSRDTRIRLGDLMAIFRTHRGAIVRMPKPKRARRSA